MQTNRNNNELSVEEQLTRLQQEYNSNMKAKRNAIRKITKLRREKSSEEEKENLLDLYLKIQIPLTIVIGGVSILAGGLEAGLIGWGVIGALQAGTSIVASNSKNKKKEHIDELEHDIFDEENSKETHQQRANDCKTKAKYLLNPQLAEEEQRKKEEELANDVVFKFVMGEPVEVERPIQYVKRERKKLGN